MSLRYTLRTLSRTPVVSVAIIAMVAIGVAALTTTFGLVDAALFRQPPFDRARDIVLINSTHTTPSRGEQLQRWSYPRIQLLRTLSTSWESLASVSGASVTYTGNGDAEQLHGEFVSSEYFRTLGVRGAAQGRLFDTTEDHGAGAHPVVVLSHDLWTSRFGAEASIVGRAVTLNGHVLTVVGVAPRGFRGLSDRSQLWMPAMMAPLLTYPGYLTTDQNFISVVARRNANVSLIAANEELRTVARQVFASLPEVNPDSGLISLGVARTLNDVRTSPSTRRATLLLLAAMVLLYLLAITNVVSLLLGRVVARQHELAVRSALGATSRDLFVLRAAECALPVALGGMIGVLLAAVASVVMPIPSELWYSSSWYGTVASFAEPSFDGRVVVFGIVLIVATTVVVSVLPAVLLKNDDVNTTIRSGNRALTQATASLRRPSARGVIIAFEAALAMMLLVAGGLMIDSFGRMRQTNLGFEPRNLLIFDLRVPDSRVSTAEAPQYLRRILDAIEQVPTVESATVDGEPPVTGSARSTLLIAGRPLPSGDDAPRVRRHYVAPAHFRTLGIPLIKGRAFTDDDIAERPRVVIISANAAARFWPQEEPIGQRLWFGGGSSMNSPDSSAEVIGIVGDVAYDPLLGEPFQPDFYTPYAQFTYPSRTFLVRTRDMSGATVRDIRNAVQRVEPTLPLIGLQTMSERIGTSWARQRFDALLFGMFASVALFLAATGIYATVSYAVAQRVREMGIRIALGATAQQVVRLVVREGMQFPVIGVLVGIAGSLAAGRVIAASLYQVAPGDLRVLTGTVIILLAVAVVACLLPAIRATRVDPMIAMRAE